MLIVGMAILGISIYTKDTIAREIMISEATIAANRLNRSSRFFAFADSSMICRITFERNEAGSSSSGMRLNKSPNKSGCSYLCLSYS